MSMAPGLARLARKALVAGASVALLAGALGSGGAPAGAAGEGCGTWDVVYAITGNLQLSDTPMGAGNGVYRVGPGQVVLRFERASGRVALLSYEMPERFGIEAKKAFWTTHVDTDAIARAAPAGTCGGAAEGTLRGSSVVWSTRLSGFHTDGTLECIGSLCGQFGAPPAGKSALHIGPSDVGLEPFEFGADGKTFTMASTFVSSSEHPKRTAHLSLSGREVRRSCAEASGNVCR